MIDVNVSLGQYPFRRLPHDDPDLLREMLREAGVTEAWVGNLDALLHRDLASVNDRLVKLCDAKGQGLFRPFGTIDPTLPHWVNEWRRCREIHQMTGLRLYPAYHGYDWDHPGAIELLQVAAGERVPIQIVWRIEDERTEHPLLKPARLTAEPLLKQVQELSGLKLMILNGQRDLKPAQTVSLAETGPVQFDLAMLEGLAGISRWLRQHAPGSLVLGSYAPVFVHASARLKLVESELPGPVRGMIERENAREFLAVKK